METNEIKKTIRILDDYCTLAAARGVAPNPEWINRRNKLYNRLIYMSNE